MALTINPRHLRTPIAVTKELEDQYMRGLSNCVLAKLTECDAAWMLGVLPVPV